LEALGSPLVWADCTRALWTASPSRRAAVRDSLREWWYELDYLSRGWHGCTNLII